MEQTQSSQNDTLGDPSQQAAFVSNASNDTKGVLMWNWLRKHLNFFRIHLLVFTFVPLIASVIFWGANGSYKVKYVDALYICYSAFTSTGLQSLDLSHTTTFQQFLLFFQMFVGSPIFVAWVTVLVRKNVIAAQCAHYLREKRGIGALTRAAVSAALPRFLSKTRKEDLSAQDPEKAMPDVEVSRPTTTRTLPRFSIRRVDTMPKKIDPSGNISRGVTMNPPEVQEDDVPLTPMPFVADSPRSVSQQLHDETSSNHDHVPSPLSQEVSSPGHFSSPGLGITNGSSTTSPLRSPRAIDFVPPPTKRESAASAPDGMPRTETLRQRRDAANGGRRRGYTYTEIDVRPKKKQTMRRADSHYLPRIDERLVTKQSIGFGGFPGPIDLLRRLHRYIMSKIPDEKRLKLHRPTHSLLIPAGQGAPSQLARYDTRIVPYFSFAAIVGRNSTFHGLTEEELDELGGIEYRGLRMLSWLVPAFYIAIQALGWLVNGILMSKQKYHDLFVGQWKFVQPAWAGVFQATSAVTNAGMSLVDTGLTRFQREPGVLIVTSFESLAGNTGFPVLLRFIIWIGTKILTHDGETWATLHFLLDHPRRCFLYLFPSHQTWFLLFIIFILNMIDWAGFLLLDIGNQTLDEIPVGWRVLNGFLQATSVRCAGVVSVSLSILAPAAQVLFVIMMYIAPYPIALAVRSTNVYQDRSLGIYEEDDSDDEESEKEMEFEHDKRAKHVVWGSYLAWHAKRQLSYDIWWIAGAWLLVAILERAKIWNPDTQQFDLFGILFELVSAYGSVGLSLGLSYANYSLSAAWTPTSKVVLCIVMIRGRSRGLPVAIDRAVMLPTEFARANPN